ncbi:hypothetical protein DOT_0167 [Desulfosporosinus sp. OT]|nr:hypothetical protein DOT_0167 [Desulfosporosinus sp. OT]
MKRQVLTSLCEENGVNKGDKKKEAPQELSAVQKAPSSVKT